MEEGSYVVKTDVFEGPLELLLDLIEKRKLHINDVSLATVADDFISYVDRHAEFPLAKAADFVVIASTLLLIKSKSLLPALVLNEEEEQGIEELERRLKLYEYLRTFSRILVERFGKTMLFRRDTSLREEPIFLPDPAMNRESLREAIGRVMMNLPKKELVPEAVVKKIISLEETIEKLARRIEAGIQMSFREFVGMKKEERQHIVVNFLAILELVKRGIVRVTQDATFSDILIESEHLDVPRYS